MSDYVKKKGIRCKIPIKFSDELDKKYGYIYDDKIMEDYGLSKEFEIDSGSEDYYLDKVLYYKYGAINGDYGRVRMLTEEEIKEHLPDFKKIFPDIKAEDLRYVDFCYYNCCEAPDYFDVGDYDYD